MTQSAAILAHLKDGHSITSLDSLRLFGCLRLGARIFDLQTQGVQIKSEMVKVGEKHVARYTLAT